MATKHTDTCLQKAADDEPIFVLRARDVLAPFVVNNWAAMFKFQHLQRGTWNEAAKEKYDEAMTLADKMSKWPSQKVPD